MHALAGTQPIAHLAHDHDLSRPLVYHLADQAEQALADAFAPPPPAEDTALFSLPVTERWRQRLTRALLLVCQSSSRGVHELLRDLFHCPRSLGYIHHVAHAATARARHLNGQQQLSAARVGAHDEIFPAGQPVRVGVAVASTHCYLLRLEEQRDGVTWGVRLLELCDRGFAPQAVIGDAGRGLAAGQALALPTVPRRGDHFHVTLELNPLVAALGKRAYQALAACVTLEHQHAPSERTQGRRDGGVSQKLRYARPAAASAVALADDVATLVGWRHRDILALAGPGHAERCALYDFVVAELRARAALCPHRLDAVVTYLVNQRDALLALARHLDADLTAVASAFRVPVAVTPALRPVQERDEGDRCRWPAAAAWRQHLGGRS
jgi:hypothetical protein